MSMKIIVIDEECHGVIGYTMNKRAAKQFLIDTDWVDEHSKLWNEEEQKWKSLEELYGGNWSEEFLNFTDEQMEDLGYYLQEEEVYE